MRNRALTLILLVSSRLHAQASTLDFEVASVKPAGAAAVRSGMHGGPGTPTPGAWTVENAPAIVLLTTAYHVPRQMISGPDWLTTERYNIDARLPRGATKEDFRLMLQNLLRERFRLTVHTEKVEIGVYELVIAKGGLKFKESKVPVEAPQSAAPSGSSVNFSINKDGCPVIPEGGPPMMAFGDCFVLRQPRQPIDWLVGLLSANSDRPIVDATGLKGSYDFAFYYRSEKRAQSTSTEDTSDSLDSQKGPGLFRAVEEQLGLKLEARKSLLDRIVVDHMEKRPLAN